MKSIMIVDDSPTMRGLLKLTLVRLPGFVVVEAVNGRDALSKLRVGTPAVLVTDINMPEVDGLELITEVRKTKGKETLPILVVSTRGQEAEVAKAMELGANDYLPKPIDGSELTRKLNRLLTPIKKPAMAPAGKMSAAELYV